MKIYNISPAAVRAKYAARLRFMCGRDAALRYALRHGVSLKLYRLACQLAAIERHEARVGRYANLGLG